MTGGFDRVASSYAWLERLVFGRRLQACRTACIDALANARTVLILGEGDGRFLAELVRRYPDVHVTVVDASPRMVERARARLANARASAEVRFVVGDALTLTLPDARYDAVVCNFFLDCFDPAELSRALDRIDTWLAPGGVVLLGEFVPTPRATGRVCHALLSPTMHAFFRATAGITAKRLQDIPAALSGRGLDCRRRVERLGGYLQSSVWMRGSDPLSASPPA
jgi:ubiquinone/menaquinone biosynthesis C-methylase UbiE